MPLSEFYAMARGKVESAQQKTTTCSSDQSHLFDNEFVELVWENGQIMMQGQSSRTRRSPISNNFQFQTMKLREKDLGNLTNLKTGKFGGMDSVLNDFVAGVPSGEMGPAQDEDEMPWWNYPIVESQHDYCSELLPELSGVTVNELSAQNSFSSSDRRNSHNDTIRGTSGVCVDDGLSLEQGNASNVTSSEFGGSLRPRSGQFYPWSFQESQPSIPSLRKRDDCRDSIQSPASADDLSIIKSQKQDSGLPNISSGFMNFSHFSRPAALVRANLQNVGAMGIENKGTAPDCSNLAEPMLINSSGLRNEIGSHSQHNSVPPKVDPKRVKAKLPEESHMTEQSLAVCQENAVKNDKLPNQVLGASASKGMPDGEKAIEPVVASSICSGNSVERASNEPMHDLKRKYGEIDDSEGRSEDVEEESVGVRKAAAARGGAGSKRSRAAEVHNLSERRRRDRINEKMRALQELIPNCNKADKASMLDEAIEYLKTLQLQVQIMSMGAGLYMPRMMLPPGMQHVHAAYMAHLSPVAVGMGMGMGFGMGMNGGSPGCHMIQVPSMQGPHFSATHSPPILGPTNFQGTAASNLQVFGHPSQGLAMAVPRAHLVPVSGGSPVNLAVGFNFNGTPAPVEVRNSAPSSNSKDPIQTTNSQMMHNTDVTSSTNQKSSQCQATNEVFEQSTSVLNNDQDQKIDSSEDGSSSKEDDNLPNIPACCD